jgi:hypothetical protein
MGNLKKMSTDFEPRPTQGVQVVDYFKIYRYEKDFSCVLHSLFVGDQFSR